MNLLFWKKNKLIDQFATRIADELYSRIPPASAEKLLSGNGPNKAKRVSKKEKKSLSGSVSVLSGVIESVREFLNEHKLGIYGKARLQMQFMERLKDLGYSEETINSLNEMILVETAS